MQGEGTGIRYATVITRVRPRYSARAMQLNIQGSVRLDALVGTDGLVKRTCVVRSLDPDLDSEAAIATFQWRFKPAVQNNQPVPSWVRVEMPFSLQ